MSPFCNRHKVTDITFIPPSLGTMIWSSLVQVTPPSVEYRAAREAGARSLEDSPTYLLYTNITVPSFSVTKSPSLLRGLFSEGLSSRVMSGAAVWDELFSVFGPLSLQEMANIPAISRIGIRKKMFVKLKYPTLPTESGSAIFPIPPILPASLPILALNWDR